MASFEHGRPVNDGQINCYSDGSKLQDDHTGAGLLIQEQNDTVVEKSYYLGTHPTVFQSEVYAICKVAEILIEEGKYGKNIVLNVDSRAAIF